MRHALVSLLVANALAARAADLKTELPVVLLSQEGRPPASVPLGSADPAGPSVNWTQGLIARAELTWAAQLARSTSPFPNNLGYYFAQIPGVFEKQLDYSTSLIFDEPSFRNGIQVSGFVDRVSKELAINLIAQRRRAWYTATHHAALGALTAYNAGLSREAWGRKLAHLLDFRAHAADYEPHERAVLEFALAFATDPQSYSEADYAAFRSAFAAWNRTQYASVERPQLQLRVAREARARALVDGRSPAEADRAAKKAAAAVPSSMPRDLLQSKLDSQFTELSLLCMQFVALAGMFTSLNIPDEPVIPGFVGSVVAPAGIAAVNAALKPGAQGLQGLVPPAVLPPTDAVASGAVKVAPSAPSGARVPLTSYELAADRDMGLLQGGLSVAAWGWGRGMYFPGSLVYAFQHVPDAGREEAFYSLALMFNEDQTRNGAQVGGYVDRVLKELLINKVYRHNRSRYGLEHHTAFVYNEYYRLYGGGAFRRPGMTDDEWRRASEKARAECTEKLLYMHEHEKHPSRFTRLERAAFAWTDAVMTRPHEAYLLEPELRLALREQNEREVAAGTRRLDETGGVAGDAAHRRLLDHQIAELGMFVPHMDGVGRAMTMLRLEAEKPVSIVRGKPGPGGGIVPELNASGEVIPTGYFTSRPGIHGVLDWLGVDPRVLTLHELFANPRLNAGIVERLAKGEASVVISGEEAAKTAVF